MTATLIDLAPYFRALQIEGASRPPPKRGPKAVPGIVALNSTQRSRLQRGGLKRDPDHVVLTSTERSRRRREPIMRARLDNIAVLDMETDPFDAQRRGTIRPFVCELYSDRFEPIVIWDEDFNSFTAKVVAAIEALPEQFTIYAHNGGKFDFLFLVHHLRGVVKFKGRAIMAAKIGNHEIRDSLHILPERLAAWKKDRFDYRKMQRHCRRKFRDEILSYLHSDCVYLFDIVKRFVGEFGLKISIGQAAFAELKKSYVVTHIKETMDTALRKYFFGGRVECIAGRGLFDSASYPGSPYKLYDVNSMYPSVMAAKRHPISANYQWRRGGAPGPDTVFIDLSCRNHGALVARGEQNEASADLPEGRFHTTIFEYETAKKYDLIDHVQIHWTVDCADRTSFEKFIVPMYERRQTTKAMMRDLKARGLEQASEFEETKKEDLLLKYLLTNAYGKFAQNPANFQEFFYCDADAMPPKKWLTFLDDARELIVRFEMGDARWPNIERDVEAARDILHKYSLPVERAAGFSIWAKPAPGRYYNNVGTAASITGAARAELLAARVNATDPIYCDTDSLICRELRGLDIDPSRLGAWDLEQTFDAVIIGGKKQYCCAVAGLADGHAGRLKVRCKGADLRVQPRSIEAQLEPDKFPDEWRLANMATWKNYTDLLAGDTLDIVNKAPTMNKLGEQHYITRRIRATAPLRRMTPATAINREAVI